MFFSLFGFLVRSSAAIQKGSGREKDARLNVPLLLPLGTCPKGGKLVTPSSTKIELPVNELKLILRPFLLSRISSFNN